MSVRSEEEVLAALRELESSRWDEVLDFIGYLRHLGRPISAATGAEVLPSVPLTARDLATSDLVGLWADRTDLPDSPDYARQLRRQAEKRTHG